jgi:glycosyltransferase involved in cell wall biosynthesis
MKKISVIIPVYNGERFIAKAITSILDQTYPVYEIIVIDDGSTDNTAEVIKRFPSINYFYKENAGVSHTLNFGLQKVKGDFITILDADDYFTLDKFEKQIKFLEQNEDVEIVFGCHQRFYDKPSEELTMDEKEDMRRILPAYFKSGMLARKSAFDKVGLFDESVKMGDFLDWYRRAEDMKVPMKLTDDIVMYRRVHDANITLKINDHISDFVKIMKASMDRRRGKV